MNLAKKYKQLFEGKGRSNDAALLTEKDAKTYLPIVKADAKLKQLGMINVEITPEEQLKMTFKHIPYEKRQQLYDTIFKLIPSEDREGGLFPIGSKIIVGFKSTSSSTSTSEAVAMKTLIKSSGAEYDKIVASVNVEDGSVSGRDREASGTIEIDGATFDWTMETDDGMSSSYLGDEEDDDFVLHDTLIDAVEEAGYGIE